MMPFHLLSQLSHLTALIAAFLKPILLQVVPLTAFLLLALHPQSQLPPTPPSSRVSLVFLPFLHSILSFILQLSNSDPLLSPLSFLLQRVF